MSTLVELLQKHGQRILRDQRFQVTEHGTEGAESILVESDVARILLTSHHGERGVVVGPIWGTTIRHRTGAYGLMVFEAGAKVDPPDGLGASIAAIGERLDLIQQICANEQAWWDFKTASGRILESDTLPPGSLWERLAHMNEPGFERPHA